MSTVTRSTVCERHPAAANPAAANPAAAVRAVALGRQLKAALTELIDTHDCNPDGCDLCYDAETLLRNLKSGVEMIDCQLVCTGDREEMPEPDAVAV